MDNVKIGALIAAVRKERGLTQKELGRRLHVSDRAVSKWERGLNLPDAALFEPLCRELGITVTELLRGERQQAALLELEQVINDTVALAGRKERAKKRYKWIAAALVVALFLVGKPTLEQKWLDYKNQSYRDLDTTAVDVWVHYRDSAVDMDARMIPGGGRIPRINDGSISERALYATKSLESVNNDWHIPDFDLVGEERMFFSVPHPKTEMEIKVYRWDEEQIGTNVTFEDAEDVEFTICKDTDIRGIESGDVYSFSAEPDWYYSVVAYWGKGFFEEHFFHTI